MLCIWRVPGFEFFLFAALFGWVKFFGPYYVGCVVAFEVNVKLFCTYAVATIKIHAKKA